MVYRTKTKTPCIEFLEKTLDHYQIKYYSAITFNLKYGDLKRIDVQRN